MISVARHRARIALIGISLWAVGCSKKGEECQKLIGSMNDLGTQLAEAQKVTSSDAAKPEQVAAALRPFASAARSNSESLSKSSITVPEIRRIADVAAAASLALASSSISMADAADQMKGLDTATKAADLHKKSVDDAESEIRKICGANAPLCAELAKVLSTFPAPPERTEDPAKTSAWNSKLNAWTAELTRVEIKDEALRAQVSNFERGWRDFASVLTELVRISETAKKYDTFTKSFNAQIDVANKAIGDANNFCRD